MQDPCEQPASEWDASRYDSEYAFVWKYGASLLELLAPQPGERILDLGCGSGHLSAEIAASGAMVIGIDSSAGMIAQARANHPALRFEIADGRDFTFDRPFDAIFSNAALHWMKPPEAVVSSVARALRAGGRFVAELGGQGNVGAIIEALEGALGAGGYEGADPANPWYFPSIGEYASLLEQHGFVVTRADLYDRPTALAEGEDGLRGWLQMFERDLLARLTEEQQEALIRQVEARLRPTLFRDGVWYADYRRLRIIAFKGNR